MKIQPLLILLLLSCCLLNACKSSDASDDDEVKVSGPANPVLKEAGSLHRLNMEQFFQATVMTDDIMQLSFDNFSPSSSDDEPKNKEPKTQNWLAYSVDNWDENYRKWQNNPAPLLDSSYQQLRSYRIYQNDVLLPAVSSFNRPIYTAVDKNLFEQRLGARFIWDFSTYNSIKAKTDLSGKKIKSYKELNGYQLLPNVDLWTDLDTWGSSNTPTFSDGAIVYAASMNVANDVTVVEAVSNRGQFDLGAAQFNNSAADLNTALSAYTYGGTRLAYQYTLDYKHFYTLYISFDLASNKARLYTSETSASFVEAPLVFNGSATQADIDTFSLSDSERGLLNLPAYFKPAFVGNTTDGYYYGKHYIKTDSDSDSAGYNRDLLSPVFFFNSIARDDIKNTFQQWREQEYDDYVN